MGNEKDLSRRDFLSFGAFFKDRPSPPTTPSARTRSAAELPIPGGAVARRNAIPLHRPPGAVEEGLFLDRCTQCGDCAKACPHHAIFEAPPRMRHAAGTPMINAAEAPCRMCEDLPCVAACPEKALVKEIPVHMGTASIKVVDCLAHQNQACTVCSEQCPVEGAISLHQGKPTINAETCTGCGVCVHVCPAPLNAVLFVPALMRPAEN